MMLLYSQCWGIAVYPFQARQRAHAQTPTNAEKCDAIRYARYLHAGMLIEKTNVVRDTWLH